MSEVKDKAMRAREASRVMAVASTNVKNNVLQSMADMLIKRKGDIVAANATDMDNARSNNMTIALQDRLRLDEARVYGMVDGLMIVKNLPDPIGELINGWVRPNGLKIRKQRVPIGVIGIIYEARPNVTVDAAGLCLKSGNVVLLRGSSSALNSNKVIIECLQEAALANGLPAEIVQLIEDTDRASVNELMTLNGYVDLLIPRGGAGLIQNVVKNATIPVIETGVGNCHVYVDAEADLVKAQAIAYNAKVQRPSVCNAAESLLVHADVAELFLPGILEMYKAAGVLIKGCEKTRIIDNSVEPATEQDYRTEFSDYIISVKIVDTVDEAIDHIYEYGTKHTEAIVTENITTANKFVDNTDAAAVIINASTRFTDGGEFGFGAEIGISTQKLHARGPMGLVELTTIKYIVEGNGQVRE
ncbi:MAG: glutamate-5-semialdehyde dehydrogenase [Candidatus Margulisiibacteriota bacterium]|nr:MAG: glutamate-5-semialdehyde dehydrogenase [Candidatus Margulisiibacteriota bacterium]HAR64447.1 glutamate-5-semialdehyde dehydrogenase [Candidatus Margulisiibacteriota bacterium]HCT85736.1 glutamate-5-semialdehyde dehydrogenase [Candidatus Margulisiibacteriota bacterium]